MKSTRPAAGWLRSSRGQWLTVILIVLSATLPFLGKAFHIDDPLYLAVARQILADPWDPFGAEVLWESAPESLFDANFNPPLWNYLMAGALACTGEPEVHVRRAGEAEDGTPRFRAETSRVPEVAMHLLESVFVAAAIVMLFLLSRRWVRWPITATAMVALSPAMLPGQNVMLEGPVMAFWLGSMWCHVRAIDRDDVRWSFAAGALAAAAVMTKYTSGLLLVILALHSVRHRRWRSLWIVAIPVAALMLWSLHNWLVYDRLHVLVIFSRVQTGDRTPVGVSLLETWGRLHALLRVLGSVTAMALPVLALVARRFGTWVVLMIATGSFGVAWLGQQDVANRLVARDGRTGEAIFPPSLPAHLLVFGSLGAFTVAGLVAIAVPRRGVPSDAGRLAAASHDEFLLWSWIIAVAAFAVLASPFLAVRHLLPGIPPLVWLVMRRLDAVFATGNRRLCGVVLGMTLSVSIVCGMLVAKADYDFASWYRHVAVDVASCTVAAGRTVNREVWFTGHWGWAYYAERSGVKPFIVRETEMGEGDFLLMPLLQTWQHPSREMTKHLRGAMRPLNPTPLPPLETGVAWFDRIVNWSLNSVRTVSNEVHLYGSGTYTVPWRFSRQPFDSFGVVEVKSVRKVGVEPVDNGNRP